MNSPHAPHHSFDYMVTAGTYFKKLHLDSAEKKDHFLNLLFEISNEFSWTLQAWAVLANHYHFIAQSPENPSTLKTLISKLHMLSAKKINELDRTPARKVWYQYWDSQITFEKSYYARLNYVHHNPEHHKVIGNSENYPWCSAAWFRKKAPPAFRKTIESFKTDRINVHDPF